MSKKLLMETNPINISPSSLTESVNKESGNFWVKFILTTGEEKKGKGCYYYKDLWNRKMGK